MRYISTRGQAAPRGFADVLLAGLAEDGGLFLPETWPVRTASEWRALRQLSYPDLAAEVMRPFVGGAIPFNTLRTICRDAYASFGNPAVVPLVQLETHLFAMELFHGPTLAFKDFALQLLGNLYEHQCQQRRETINVLGAVNVGFSGNFSRVNSAFRFTMTGNASLSAAGVAANGAFSISNEPGKEGMSASVTLAVPGITGSGSIAINSDGTFDASLSVSVALGYIVSHREEFSLLGFVHQV